MGIISEIEGVWDFSTMGNCEGESEPIGNTTKTFGFDENNNTISGI